MEMTGNESCMLGHTILVIVVFMVETYNHKLSGDQHVTFMPQRAKLNLLAAAAILTPSEEARASRVSEAPPSHDS